MPLVAAAVDAARVLANRNLTVTAESIMAGLDRAAVLAEASNNSVALTTALMAQAKLAGLLVDRQDVTTRAATPADLAPDLATARARAIASAKAALEDSAANDAAPQQSNHIN
jgi:hypothetical protein